MTNIQACVSIEVTKQYCSLCYLPQLYNDKIFNTSSMSCSSEHTGRSSNTNHHFKHTAQIHSYFVCSWQLSSLQNFLGNMSPLLNAHTYYGTSYLATTLLLPVHFMYKAQKNMAHVSFHVPFSALDIGRCSHNENMQNSFGGSIYTG